MRDMTAPPHLAGKCSHPTPRASHHPLLRQPACHLRVVLRRSRSHLPASLPLLRLDLCSISEPPHQLLLRTAHYSHGSICGFKSKGTHRLIGRVYYRFMLVVPSHRTTAVHYLAIAISTQLRAGAIVNFERGGSRIHRIYTLNHNFSHELTEAEVQRVQLHSKQHISYNGSICLDTSGVQVQGLLFGELPASGYY
ncbi:hypothetical protein BC826DRAFT_114107 [Russula brevipes]|nr:hypothetical protein BC826DRAFT_114107 [Russula brevipes]